MKSPICTAKPPDTICNPPAVSTRADIVIVLLGPPSAIAIAPDPARTLSLVRSVVEDATRYVAFVGAPVPVFAKETIS